MTSLMPLLRRSSVLALHPHPPSFHSMQRQRELLTHWDIVAFSWPAACGVAASLVVPSALVQTSVRPLSEFPALLTPPPR